MGQNIILDIDETLIHTFDEDDNARLIALKPMKNQELYPIRKRLYTMKLTDVGEPTGSGDIWELWGIERPNLREFIDYCMERFDYVIIWSAGKRKYVEKLTDRLFRAHKGDPNLILNWDNCRKGVNQYDKPILSMHDQFPALKDDIRLDNTFIVDDRIDNFKKSNKDNGICIPAYSPSPDVETLLESDTCLLDLIAWFERYEVIYSSDIRDLKKPLL